jgi:uncharacterized protein DUF4276
LIVQILVEGEGDEKAVPVLLRRLQRECGAFSLVFDRPLRKRRSDLVNEQSLREAVRLALRQERGCDGILIVFDGDKDCPKSLAPRVREWVQTEAPGIPSEVVIAHHEYEAWFLGSLESLRGKRRVLQEAVSLVNPESIRGTKERLKASMDQGAKYIEPVDQPALTALFDLAAAHRSCRSFRRMVRAFGLLASAAGAEIGEWPPASWL